jgi:hypothetical protein
MYSVDRQKPLDSKYYKREDEECFDDGENPFQAFEDIPEDCEQNLNEYYQQDEETTGRENMPRGDNTNLLNEVLGQFGLEAFKNGFHPLIIIKRSKRSNYERFRGSIYPFYSTYWKRKVSNLPSLFIRV